MKNGRATPNEPLIKDRVQQYLEENVHQTYLNVGEMAKALQTRYPEYSKYKMKTFHSLVEQAYKHVSQSYGLENSDKEDSGSDIEFLNVTEHTRFPSHDYIHISSEGSDGCKSADSSKPASPVKPTRSGSFESDKSDESDDIPDERKYRPRSLINYAIPQCTFNDVFGMDHVVKELYNTLLYFTAGQMFETLNVTTTKGILLYGPSGCGKSYLARCIAGHLTLPLIEARATELSVIVPSGDAEARLREYFNFAFEKAPCVLLIDDIDLIASTSIQRDMERRLSGHLVDCMDRIAKENHRVLVVATTNRLDLIEPSLKRAGRFGNEIAIGIPNRAARAQMIKHITLEMGLGETFPFDKLAALTPGYVMSDLQLLAAQAVSTGIQRLYLGKNIPTVEEKKNEPEVVDLLDENLSEHSGEASKEPQEKIEANDTLDKTSKEEPEVIDVTMDENLSEHSGEGSKEPQEKIEANATLDKTSKEEPEVIDVTMDENLSEHSGEGSKEPQEKIEANATLDKTSKEEPEVIDVTMDENLSEHSGEGSKEPQEKIEANDTLDKTSKEEPEVIDVTMDEVDENQDKIETEDDLVEVIEEDAVKKTDENEEKGDEESGIEKITIDDVEENMEDQPEVTDTISSTTPLEDAPAQSIDIDPVDDTPMEPIEEKEPTEEVEEEVVASTSKIGQRSPLVENSFELHISHESNPELSPTDLKNLIKTDSEIILNNGVLNVTFEDFCEALKYVTPIAKREGFIVVPNVKWKDVGSLHTIRDELRLAVMVPIKYPERLEQLGLAPASGTLMFGPPGCGKTLLAKAIANEAGVNFISVKGPELLNMYVGESERGVRLCFQRAKTSAPCVIFFDEFDSLCSKRSEESDSGSGTRIVNQLLTEMDGIEDRQGVFVLAATNRPDILDPAVLRPGRLEKILYVGLPNKDDRLDILRTVTKDGKKPRLHEDVDIHSLASRTEGFTGADIVALVRKASTFAFKASLYKSDFKSEEFCVTNAHFMEAMRDITPSVSDEDKIMYNTFKAKYVERRLATSL